ncbi:ATP-dependent DNA ligase [Bradyrhizobium sp. 23AC]
MAYKLCLTTASKQVPNGPDWIHEVKHDGYRMLVIQENERVRLLSRNGTDCTKRYPWIAEAALTNRQKQFVIDNEAVFLGVDGVSDFNALHSRKHDHEVQLYAFDILAMGGNDVRALPLHLSKPRAATGSPAERDHHGAFRRHRARSISSRLLQGPARLQTSPRSPPPSRSSRAM